MTAIHTGACLCGAVRLRARGPLRGVVYCHCSQCRRQTGHVFAATSVAAADLEVEGSDNVAWYEASPEARRGFCRTCGSVLFWRRAGAASLAVPAGLFDQPSGLRGEAHIFTADKGDYYEITDGLPQFPGTGQGAVT
jgi:hypothetical protein